MRPCRHTIPNTLTKQHPNSLRLICHRSAWQLNAAMILMISWEVEWVRACVSSRKTSEFASPNWSQTTIQVGPRSNWDLRFCIMSKCLWCQTAHLGCSENGGNEFQPSYDVQERLEWHVAHTDELQLINTWMLVIKLYKLNEWQAALWNPFKTQSLPCQCLRLRTWGLHKATVSTHQCTVIQIDLTLFAELLWAPQGYSNCAISPHIDMGYPSIYVNDAVTQHRKKDQRHSWLKARQLRCLDNS